MQMMLVALLLPVLPGQTTSTSQPAGPEAADTAATTPPGDAPSPSSPWATFALQLRPRFEKALFGHLGVPRRPGELAGAPSFLPTQRTRLSIDTGIDLLRAHTAIQDVRTWGDETNTLSDFSADGIDFHEAWFQLGERTWLRLGRQEIKIDEERLMGAVDWTQQGRAFDALVVGATRDNYEVRLGAMRLRDSRLHDLVFAHGAMALANLRLSIPVFVESNTAVAARERGADRDDWLRVTGGLHLQRDGDLFWRVEAYAQSGTDHLAFMGGARVGYRVRPALQPVVWIDYLSGDRDLDDERTGAFDTLYATNHKFYGYQDRFTAIPAHTGGGGLIDIALKNQGKLGPGTLEVAVHEFLLANAEASPATGRQRSPLIGAELDLVYVWPLHQRATLHTGGSLFVDQGDFRGARERALPGARWVHNWLYLMIDVVL